MRLASVAAVAVMLFGPAPQMQAEEPILQLLGWVPDRANAALFLNADGVRNSPFGKKVKWGTADDPTTGLDSLPANVSQLVVASQNTPGGGSAWEVRIATLRKDVAEAEFLKMLGGTNDTIAGKTVSVSPKYGITAMLAAKTVGAYQPSNRQDAGRWLREASGRVSPYLSPYIRGAALQMTDQTPVVVAFDTRDVFEPGTLKNHFSESESLKKSKVDPAAVAEVFAGMTGVTISVKAEEQLSVRIQLDFAKPPTGLEKVAKIVALDLLETAGVREDEMDKWNAVVTGNAIMLHGDASRETVRSLLAPFLRPSVSALQPQSPSGKNGDPKSEPSVRYFREVSKQYKALRTTRYSSYTNLAYKYNTTARQIDDLPILNVDDELLQWGASVTATIRTIAINAQLTGGQIDLIQANRTMSSISSPNYFYGSAYGGGASYWGGYGYGYNYALPTGTTTQYTVSNYAQVGNLTRMTNIQEQQFRVKTWENVERATGELRRKMVKKYNVEF
jgi:hypothetical protein